MASSVPLGKFIQFIVLWKQDGAWVLVFANTKWM